MRLRTTLPAVLLAVSALALAAQALDLKWSPKVGDKANYKVEGTFDLAGMGEIKLSGTRTETVTSVDGDKIVLTSNSKLAANAMGNEVPIPDSTEVTTVKPDGTVSEIKLNGADGGGSAMRLARATMLVYPSKPIAVGDAWTAEGKKDEKADLPGYKLDFKLVGEEKVGTWDTWKITAKGGEVEGATPTKVEATYWIDKKDGSMVRSLAQLTDAVFQGPGGGIEIPPLSGKMDVTRQP